jgi:hypothetical protein
MAEYRFERETRTAESESFVIMADEREYGRADIHYGPDVVNATLCLPEDVSEDEIQDVIGEIDERIVMSANPFRDDFIVTVWIGRQAGVYSEDYDEELDEDIEGNGHLE